MRNTLLLGILMVLLAACSGGESTASTQSSTGGAPSAEGENGAKVIPEMNGVQVSDGLIFAGQPSEEELRQLQAAGYRVLDLRREVEDRGFDEAALASELGLHYQNVPVDQAALMDQQVHTAFRKAVQAEGEGPLLVHCASGNRVAGLYYAMLVEEEDVSREDALKRAKELGLTSSGVESGINEYLDR